MNENRANFYAYKEKDGSWRIETPEGPVILDSKTKLKDALKAATQTKGKELDAKLSALLDGCTESKAGQPTLTRTK